METADWNWLLSTSAQSAAALVAIIGGFLVSRLIQLAAERRLLLQRREDLRNELTHNNEELGEAARRLLLFHTGGFLTLVLGRIADFRNKPSELQNLADTYRRSHPEVTDVAQEFDALVRDVHTIIDRAFAELEPLQQSGQLPLTFDEYRRSSGSRRNLLQDRIFMTVFESLREHSNVFGYGPLHIQQYLLTDFRQDLAVENEEQYRVIAGNWRRLQGQRLELSRQLRGVESGLTETARPPGMRFAVFTLVYFACSGVVVPLWYLSRQPLPDLSTAAVTLIRWPLSHRDLILGLFGSGLAILLVYLGYLLLSATRADSEQRKWKLTEPSVMALPESPSFYPEAQPGQIQNIMVGYLSQRGIAVQLGVDQASGASVASCHYKGVERSFTGATALEAIRQIYDLVYEDERLGRNGNMSSEAAENGKREVTDRQAFEGAPVAAGEQRSTLAYWARLWESVREWMSARRR